MSNSPPIAFGGLASGIDTNALIDGLMGVERIPLNRNTARQQSLTSAKSTLSSVLNTFTAVKTAADALNSSSAFASYSLVSSDDKVLVATATGAARAGTYSIEVKQLAQETRAKSLGFASSTDALAQTGTFSLTVGGTVTDIAIDAADSLAGIATKINASGAAVNASVVKTGTEAFLVVSGKGTGATNAVTMAETGGLALGMTTYQTSKNSRILLDNQFTIERDTNQFSDVLDGVTITAKSVSATPATLVVKSDSDAQASKIQSFVTAYNNAVSAGHLSAGWGSIKASSAALAGDSAVRSALTSLGTTVSNVIPGITGKYKQLANVGIKLSQDGSLTLDKTKLAAALEADSEGVAKLFLGDSATSTKGAMSVMSSVVEKLTKASTGTLPLRITQYEKQITQLGKDADKLQERLALYEAGLRKKFNALETAVSKIQFQGRQLQGFVSNSSNAQ